jgi:hypothetical protein
LLKDRETIVVKADDEPTLHLETGAPKLLDALNQIPARLGWHTPAQIIHQICAAPMIAFALAVGGFFVANQVLASNVRV